MLLFKCMDVMKIPCLLKLLNINHSVVCSGEGENQDINKIICWAGNMEEMVEYLTDDTLIITPDCSAVLLAASLAFINGVKIGGILITDEGKLSSGVANFCTRVMSDEKLPVLFCNSGYEDVCIKLKLLSVHEDSENYLVIQNSSTCTHTENH
ncbi:TPA: DRTGG domain-containing protein [Salmonella enterica subsp. enterica serovar Eastbourne]